MTKKEAEAKVKEILDLTASYASAAYGWDIKEEEDLSDFTDSLLEILIEEP